jgi:maleate isomerase
VSLPRRSIGAITPSANVVVEWTAIRLLSRFPDVGVQFARVPVRGAVDPFPEGYDTAAMLEAARLLADARPQAILWAGSKGALVGIEQDETLCAEIKQATGVEATTPTLALREFVAGRPRRAALVTPYTQAYQARLIEGLGRLGIVCASERHAGVADNLAYADVGPQAIAAMMREAAREAANPDFVLTWCTNFAVADVVESFEREFPFPVVDATLLGLNQALRLVGRVGAELIS